MDVGAPKDFMVGNSMILNHYSIIEPEKLHKGQNIIGNVLAVPILFSNVKASDG
jgi:hypothetical protein